jgi:glycerol uptake facilitator-like aquaporin
MLKKASLYLENNSISSLGKSHDTVIETQPIQTLSFRCDDDQSPDPLTSLTQKDSKIEGEAEQHLEHLQKVKSERVQKVKNAVAFVGGLIRYPPESIEIPEGNHGKLYILLGIYEFFSPATWRATLVEFFATLLLIFTSIAISIAVDSPSPSIHALLVGLAHIPLFSILIFSAAISGAHLNPLFTIATVLTKLTTPARGSLYIGAQIVGAFAGAGLMYGILGKERSLLYHLGGCDVGTLPLHSAFISEFSFDMFILFVAFGTAFDPRQSDILGSVGPPIFVGLSFGICICLSGVISPVSGYTGAGLNPIRCLAPAVILGENVNFHWIYWVGALFASFLNAVFYLIKPFVMETKKSKKRKDVKMKEIKIK